MNREKMLETEKGGEETKKSIRRGDYSAISRGIPKKKEATDTREGLWSKVRQEGERKKTVKRDKYCKWDIPLHEGWADRGTELPASNVFGGKA